MKEIYLSDVKKDPKGRCIDCSEFIPDNEDMKACHCKDKTGYITQNALRKLACQEYSEIIRPEFHDYLLKLGFETKAILEAIKEVKKKDYDNTITIEVLTRDLLESKMVKIKDIEWFGLYKIGLLKTKDSVVFHLQSLDLEALRTEPYKVKTIMNAEHLEDILEEILSELEKEVKK